MARGHALQAEIMELGSSLPEPLQDQGRSKYSPVLFDYGYFKDPEALERRVEAQPPLMALDVDFRQVSAAWMPRCDVGQCRRLRTLCMPKAHLHSPRLATGGACPRCPR